MTGNWPQIPEECRSVWAALDDLSPEPLPAAAAARIRSAVDSSVTTTSNRRHIMTRSRAVLAATVVIALTAGGAAGFVLGAARGGEHAGSTAVNPAGQQYLLLVYETEATERAVRERGMDAIVAEYAGWAGSLAARGMLVSAEKLTPTPGWVGAEVSASNPVSGFFVIRAQSRDQALEVARRSPHALHGGIVEVRGIDPAGE